MSNYDKIFTIQLGRKAGDRHIDELIANFLKKYSSSTKSEKFIFDISNVEWISNQELLVLTGLFRYLFNSKVDFKVQFRSTKPSYKIDHRKAVQFIQIWDVWKIYKVIPDRDFSRYFDIDGKFIDSLKTKFNIRSGNQEIYERYGVTPFLELEKIQNYEDRRIAELIDSIYRLGDATNEILLKHNCFIPIQNQTLSSIITKELYENFLDHFTKSIFNTLNQYAFMSLSLRKKFDEEQNDQGKIQRFLKLNFEEEQLDEVRDFFYDKTTKRFNNQSLLELSFLDFGEGIPTTLEKSYKETDLTSFSKSHFKQNVDTRILEYAFRFDSSQHPIHERYSEDLILPRGLFDLLSIVKRFEGLLVARSNYGKLAYDFSGKKSFEQAVTYFGNQSLFFPGTLISIYLPERTLKTEFDTSKIKPIEDITSYVYSKREIKFLSIFEILSKLRAQNVSKDNLYDSLLDILSKEFTAQNKKVLVYLDFEGYEIDKRISKKILYFLISDYRVNLKNNVVIINPPPKTYLDVVQKELLDLTAVDRQFKIHPTPFVYLNEDEWKINIFWLGVFSEEDIEKLSNLLLDDHDLRKSDFQRPEDIIGHINYYDAHGNLKSLIDNSEILKVYKERIIESRNVQAQFLLKKYIKTINGAVFLCSGNYYQDVYVQLFDALSNTEECLYLARALYYTIKEKLKDLSQYKFLSITASSQKIIEAFIRLAYVQKDQTITLDNYHGFIDEPQFEQGIKEGDKVILVCDVVSTGYMIKQVEKGLDIRGAYLEHIAVLVNAIDKEFEANSFKYNELDVIISSLWLMPASKFRREKIKDQLVKGTLKVIRINPFTNTPISDSIKNSNYNNSVLLSNEEFVDAISSNDIKVGYFKFNNLIHPYFFDMENILSNEQSSLKLLHTIFNKIESQVKTDIEIIFYPKNSGIKFLDSNILKDKILLNQRVKILELERFSTSEGWRFPHPAEFMRDVSFGKTVMILDDGSCTGDSIIQMIDEVAFLNVKEIIVLTLIGRVNNHKREFFSRIDSIHSVDGTIALKIFFGSHWNIPTYYSEDSPVIAEKRWLENIISFQNTPTRIKEIASHVLKELTPKSISTGNNKHLLKNKNGDEINRDLVIIREQIGKITSYRFYEEHFEFFDKVIAKYESNFRSSDRYKTIELICAVFLHEPYLFDKFKNVVPDLVDKIEEFVLALTIGNPKRGFAKIEKEQLYFEWKNKDVLHLFFVVFRDTRLVEVLSIDALVGIIDRFGKNASDLNYIFFKLIRYMPLKKEIITEKKYSGKIIQIIEGAKEKITDLTKLNHLKILTSFLSTLPFRENDFRSHLGRLKNNFNKLREDEYHNEYIYNDKQVIIAQLNLLIKNKKNNLKFDDEKNIIRNAWEPISSFIEDLLKFSSLYPSFFLPFKEKGNSELDSGNGSLREIHGKLQEIFFAEEFTNAEDASLLLDKLFASFIMEDSTYPLIFNNVITPSVKEVLDHFISEQDNLKITLSNSIDVSVDFPLFYLKELVFKEIFKNLRHAKIDEEIHINCEKLNENLLITIMNAINVNHDIKGGGKGLERLNRLNKFPIETIYESQLKGLHFIQRIKFKAI